MGAATANDAHRESAGDTGLFESQGSDGLFRDLDATSIHGPTDVPKVAPKFYDVQLNFEALRKVTRERVLTL